MRRFDVEWQELIGARAWLAERGLRLVDRRGPEGMDQGYDVYRSDRMGLRILADRSQWFVELRPVTEDADSATSERWFSLEAWSDCLGSPVLFHDSRATRTDADWSAVLANSWWLEPQLTYLRAHFAEITDACSPERIDATRACLDSA
jgi:hypothetical protein